MVFQLSNRMEGVGRVMPPPSPVISFALDPNTGVYSGVVAWCDGTLGEFFEILIDWKEIS